MSWIKSSSGLNMSSSPITRWSTVDFMISSNSSMWAPLITRPFPSSPVSLIGSPTPRPSSYSVRLWTCESRCVWIVKMWESDSLWVMKMCKEWGKCVYVCVWRVNEWCGGGVYTISSICPSLRLAPPWERSVNTVNCTFLSMSCKGTHHTCLTSPTYLSSHTLTLMYILELTG